MKRPVRILLTVVAVIAVIVCVFCILFIVQYVRGKSVSDKLGSGVRSGQVVEPLDPQDDGKYMAINVDFDSLHDVNPEIYAWIEVPGTNINYAVVQSAADDLFYDDHGVDRSYYSGGSIRSPLTGVTSDSWDTPAGHRVYDACRGFSVSWVCWGSGASSASSTSC